MAQKKAKLVYRENYEKGTAYKMEQLLELFNNSNVEIKLENTSWSQFSDGRQELGLIVIAKIKTP